MSVMNKKVRSVAKTAGAIKKMRARRISAIAGIGYKILVAVDGTKESWKALDAVLYFLDKQTDSLTTITITDSKTSENIKSEIKRVVEKSDVGLKKEKLQTKVMTNNNVRPKDRVLEFTNKGNYDLLAVGMQGRRCSEMNPQRVYGSLNDPSIRAAKCTKLIAPNCAELPAEGECAVFVVVIDGSVNSNYAYETCRQWLKEGDYLYVIKVGDPRGDEPDVPTNLRSSFLGRQYSMRLEDLDTASFEVITGKSVVPQIIEFCNKKNAHFLMCGADEMQTWMAKGEMIGSVSDALVRESSCFVIISQLNIVHD